MNTLSAYDHRRAQVDMPLFSFIIPAYNCGEYVEEAILSVVKQDIGFEQFIQLVIVDDGSTDETGIICKSYAQSFPENVVYIKQSNAGASAARRRGLASATGTYVTFLDADDVWTTDAARCVRDFFEAHPDVTICTARHHFFGAFNGKHPLHYKYEVDRVIDLSTDHNYPQLSMSNAFFLRSVVNPEYFDTRLQLSEDYLVVNLMLLDEMRYGVISGPTYWYRRRDSKDSAINRSTSMKAWYLDTPRYCYRRLFEESKRRYGVVLPFIQYSVMYDLQWRIKVPSACPLTDEELAEYRSFILGFLEEIDDEHIVAQRNLTQDQKLYILALKYGLEFADAQEAIVYKGIYGYLKKPDQSKQFLFCASDQNTVQIDFIERRGDVLCFEGRFFALLPSRKLKLRARSGSWSGEANNFSRPDRVHDSFFDKAYFTETGFVIDIPVNLPQREILFFIQLESQVVNADLRSGKFCPISFRHFDFTTFGDVALCTVRKKTNKLSLRKEEPAKLALRETLYEGCILVGTNEAAKKKLSYRRLAVTRELAPVPRREKIWLISDRTTMAGDNGEALFVYLSEHPVDGVKPYFVIDFDSPDYQRMKQYGKVVAHGSAEHERLQLRADAIISSAADEYVFDRLGKSKFLVKNFDHFKYVFLQHGITKDDMSSWLNRWRKNISLFVTAAKPEYDSIINNPAYGYGPEQVKLTGFPRHDKLLEEAALRRPDRKVLIAPTWRENLAGPSDPITGIRVKNPAFEQSDYYKFYQKLINDQSLAKAADELGYEIVFLIHPALVQEAEKFTSPFVTVRAKYEYRKEFIESAIMVTDFSSVAFDFALLRKPLLYAHFDFESFYSDHLWERGYFDYTRDGFGEVCATYERTVGALVDLMADPHMPSEYRDRADAFFYEPPNGRSRCELVVDAIRAL